MDPRRRTRTFGRAAPDAVSALTQPADSPAPHIRHNPTKQRGGRPPLVGFSALCAEVRPVGPSFWVHLLGIPQRRARTRCRAAAQSGYVRRRSRARRAAELTIPASLGRELTRSPHSSAWMPVTDPPATGRISHQFR